jgi:hypothetical protein
VVDYKWLAIHPGDSPDRLEEFDLSMEHFPGLVLLLTMIDDSLGCIFNQILKHQN